MHGEYWKAGFNVVHQDAATGPVLQEVVGLLHSTVDQSFDVFSETPRQGLWIDDSEESAQETAARVLGSLECARIPWEQSSPGADGSCMFVVRRMTNRGGITVHIGWDTQEVKAMRPRQFVVKPGDRSAALSVVGTNVVVLVSAPDSKSQQITLQSGDEGTGPPPHSHDWDESFYVTRGQVHFACAGQTTLCVAGTFVHVPAGTVHAFSYGPGGGEMLEVTGAGSKAIQMFTALDREIPPGPLDVPKVVEVAGEHGVRFHI